MATHSRRIPSTCPKAILFDLDNTLIPTRQGDKAACDKVRIDPFPAQARQRDPWCEVFAMSS